MLYPCASPLRLSALRCTLSWYARCISRKVWQIPHLHDWTAGATKWSLNELTGCLDVLSCSLLMIPTWKLWFIALNWRGWLSRAMGLFDILYIHRPLATGSALKKGRVFLDMVRELLAGFAAQMFRASAEGFTSFVAAFWGQWRWLGFLSTGLQTTPMCFFFGHVQHYFLAVATFYVRCRLRVFLTGFALDTVFVWLHSKTTQRIVLCFSRHSKATFEISWDHVRHSFLALSCCLYMGLSFRTWLLGVSFFAGFAVVAFKWAVLKRPNALICVSFFNVSQPNERDLTVWKQR